MEFDLFFNYSLSDVIDPKRFIVSWEFSNKEVFNLKEVKIEICDITESDEEVVLIEFLPAYTFKYEFVNTSLQKNKLYKVTVNIKTEKGSIYSASKNVITCTDFRDAVWICGEKKEDFTAFYTDFRKKFFVDEKPKVVLLYTSFQLYGKLSLNGHKVTGYVTPAPSNIEKNKYYLCYDVTDFVVIGENEIFSQLYYVNGDGQNFVNGTPGFICKLFVYGKDSILTVVSNEEWDVCEQTVYCDNTPYLHQRNIATVQYLDKTRKPFENDKHKAKKSEIILQNSEMFPQQIPEGTVYEKFSPKELFSTDKSVRIFDCDKIVSGWVELCVESKKEQEITVRYSESLDDNGFVSHQVANVKSDFYIDMFKIPSNGNIQIQCDGMYKTFRYFEISGVDSGISFKDINVIRAGNRLNKVGDFYCSNELLNKIYEACILTQQNNTINGLVDCPHREQSQYIEDSNLQAETLMYNFVSYPFLKKVLDDFSFAQYHDGTFPYIYPATYNGDILKIPEWDLYYIELLEKTYIHFGEINVLKMHYQTCKKIAENIISKIDESGLVVCNKDWHIDDWPYPKTTNEVLKYRAVENILSFNNLKIFSKIAKILENSEDSSKYWEYAELLKSAILEKLFDYDKKFFYDGVGTKHISQAVNVAAVYYGVLPQKYKNSVLEQISKQPLECSVVMANKLLRVLFENGYEKRAYEILASSMYPSWGYMIEKGYKTVWEGFDDKESHTHAWNGYAARIMQEYICGISFNGVKDEVYISPFYPQELQFASATVITPHGKVHCKWERTGDEIILSVKAPTGMSVIVNEKDNNCEGLIDYCCSENKNGNWHIYKRREENYVRKTNC